MCIIIIIITAYIRCEGLAHGTYSVHERDRKGLLTLALGSAPVSPRADRYCGRRRRRRRCGDGDTCAVHVYTDRSARNI